MKKLIIGLLLAACIYYAGGFVLLTTGRIDKLPVFVNKVLKNKSDEDASHAEEDGPFVFHQKNEIRVCYIVKKDSGFSRTCHSHSIKDSLRVGPAETPLFRFVLKSHLTVDPVEYALPEKMCIISDIEGNFDAFVSILRANRVIDTSYNWTFDSGHLILLGDFVDRGLKVTETLWLIYKLENEAERYGGKVHFILGNHEVMNMHGQLKYVRNKYKENCKLLSTDYQDCFSINAELGRWLRTKNVIEKAGPVVFVHGGVSPDLVGKGLSLNEINKLCRKRLSNSDPEIESANDELVFDTQKGLLWYRGIVKKEPDAEEMKSIMKFLKADRLVLGHTLVDSIVTLYNGDVIAIDLDHAESYKKGVVKCLWYENKTFFVIDNKGNKKKLTVNL